MSDHGDLELVLRSGVPIIVVETADETRFLERLTRIAIARPKADYRPLFRWSVTDGLQRLDLELEPQRHAVEPEDVLGHIRAVTKPGIYVLLDFHPFLKDPVNIRLLKDIALAARASGTVVMLVSHGIELPRELESLSARFELRLPDAGERRRIVMRMIAEYQQSESGRRAEIEQAVVAALYAAHATGTNPGQPHLVDELSRTRPLSVVMAERVEALREWARSRTVPAD